MITITESAARHFEAMIARSQGRSLKLSVRKTGCSGYAYALELFDLPDVALVSFESNGVTIYVPEKDLVALTGLELDYKKNGFYENVVFNNPNVRSECGCGESFRI